MLLMKKFLANLTAACLLCLFSILNLNSAAANNDNKPDTPKGCDIQAGFSFEVRQQSVKFINLSQGNYTNITWEVNNNIISQENRKFEYDFNKAGQYSITLTATNVATGCANKFTGDIYIFE